MSVEPVDRFSFVSFILLNKSFCHVFISHETIGVVSLTPLTIEKSMKKILMLLAAAGVSSAMMAQQKTEVMEEARVVLDGGQGKYPVMTNRFWDNWFISLGGGAEATFGSNDKAGDFGGRISPTLNLSVGKWFTPGLGVRLQYSGLQARGYTYDGAADYVKGMRQDGGYYKQRFNYMNLHADMMLNLNALFGGYNPDRVYEVIPYLGAGFTHNYSKPHREALALNAGVVNRFRISDAMDVNLELGFMGTENKFDGELNGKHGYDGVLSATAGVTYRFPARGFRRPVSRTVSQLELAALREELGRLAQDNQRLSDALADASKQPIELVETEVVVSEPVVAPRTVFFAIGSAEVSSREAMNLSYLAEQMKKFDDVVYTVSGYADSSTGTPQLNQELSRKRAQAVIDVLVNRYGIAPERLKIDASGGVDKFGKPILNRVVLVQVATE